MSDSILREPTFLILTALAGGRRHGYAIIAEVAALSEQRVSLKVSTLYAALERLTEQELIESAGDEVVGGRLRRYYRITNSGAQALNQAAQRMSNSANAALTRLQERGSRLGEAVTGA